MISDNEKKIRLYKLYNQLALTDNQELREKLSALIKEAEIDSAESEKNLKEQK